MARYTAENEQELVTRLKANGCVRTWFHQRFHCLCGLIYQSVGSNTFRAFRKTKRARPSTVFRRWAWERLQDETTCKDLVRIHLQTDYDKWLDRFAKSLRTRWVKCGLKKLGFGHSMKMVNLLLKHFILWSQLPEAARKRLIGFLHVPLDSIILAGIRQCILTPKIPATASMGFVTKTHYKPIQDGIRQIMDDVPPIYLDVLLWNVGISRDLHVAGRCPYTPST